MKKLHLLLLGLTICLFSACHDKLWDAIDDLDVRVARLEELCKEMNTNIVSIQTIVNVVQSGDYITGVTEIKKDGEVIGYTITFANHDPITIYHGQDGKDGADGKDGQNGADGKDGQDGADGKDGITPLLKIENGYWYISYDNGATWTESGKATGDNGQDGQNGTDGKDGQDGTNGKDGVTPLLKIENGYWYISYDNGATWAQLGKATGEDGKDGANGTNGTDGKDGQDGADGSNGQDGITPQLKIENGYWYVSYDNGTTWTQFGKATGADGQDGQNGTDGKDGKDGVTPQLKIEEGYWFISYDNGATWTQLGKATGEDGKDGTDGADGKDGQDGDSMFQSVTQDENYVYFTLADGTVIKIAKGTSTEEEQPNSEFMFIVTYDANGGEGTMQPDTFYYGVAKKITPRKFTRASYCFVNWNTKVDGSGISYSNEQELMISKNITLYANWKAVDCKNYEYVDLGLSVLWSTCNIGASKPEGYGSYFAWGETYTKSDYTTPTYAYYINGGGFTKYCTNSSYGRIDNKTILDATDDVARVKWGGNWRIPTSAEISELRAKCSWTWTTNGYKVTSKINGNSIFLPAAGYKSGTSSTNVGYGYYWTNSLYTSTSDYNAIVLYFYSSNVGSSGLERWYGGSVRPVCR